MRQGSRDGDGESRRQDCRAIAQVIHAPCCHWAIDVSIDCVNSSSIDRPILLHPLTPQTLLLATDSSALYLYDLRANSTFTSSKPHQTHHPHDDYVTSLTALPPTDASTSGTSKQWVSTGGTTVAVTDLRRGVLVKSEDQGEELLSSTIVNGKLVVGGEKGGLRLWQVGVWDDNEETVTVGKGASADVLASVPEAMGKEQMLAVGMDDGVVRFVGMGGKRAKVLDFEVKHDEVEGVLGLEFEAGGRMCSGGGAIVKVWEESLAASEGVDGEDEEETAVDGKRADGFDSDEQTDGDEADGDVSSEEQERPRKRKKRKRNKGIKNGEAQHVMVFKGMD